MLVTRERNRRNILSGTLGRRRRRKSVRYKVFVLILINVLFLFSNHVECKRSSVAAAQRTSDPSINVGQ